MPKKGTNTKKNSRSRSKNVSKDVEKRTQSRKEDNSEVARKVLSGKGKNPYYYNGITIQNLNELQNHLQNFSEHEARWLADWIDYLGDNRTAVKIRESPSEFKTIINERYSELKNKVKHY